MGELLILLYVVVLLVTFVALGGGDLAWLVVLLMLIPWVIRS